MMNEISNKVSSQDYSKKTVNKNSELDKRSDLRQDDNVEISGKQPVEMPVDKILQASGVNDNAVQMKSDVQQEAKSNIQGTDKGNKELNNQAELSDEERQVVEELKNRDAEVRQHENAHAAAAGAYAQGISFEYQAGPDGRRYAVGGEVSIDTAPVHDDPDATIAKARVIRSAANAPADPSAQDRQVAAAASRMEASARAEKMKEASSGNEDNNISVQSTDNNSEVNAATAHADNIISKEENSPVDSLTSAYGKKETEVGKVIRMTA